MATTTTTATAVPTFIDTMTQPGVESLQLMKAALNAAISDAQGAGLGDPVKMLALQVKMIDVSLISDTTSTIGKVTKDVNMSILQKMQ